MCWDETKERSFFVCCAGVYGCIFFFPDNKRNSTERGRGCSNWDGAGTWDAKCPFRAWDNL